MTSKKELLSRIQGLESRVTQLMQESTSRDWVENFVRNSIVKRSEFDFLRDTVGLQGQVLKRYREVLLTSGVITPCDASRTEFQWQEEQNDKFGGAFHFKVNKVQTKKEKE